MKKLTDKYAMVKGILESLKYIFSRCLSLGVWSENAVKQNHMNHSLWDFSINIWNEKAALNE